MTIHNKAILNALFLGILLSLATPLRAQDYAPAITYETMLDNISVYESGEVSIGNFDLAFGPEEPLNVAAAVVDKTGTVIGSVPFAEFYGRRDGAFGRIKASASAPIMLAEPGLYAVVFVVDGTPVSRFPFLLKASEKSDDPFAGGGKKLSADGLWRQLGHITSGSYKNEPVVILTAWLGSQDLAKPDTHFEPILVTLKRDGELVAHSKRETAGFNNVFFERTAISLFEPHTEKESPNAIMLPMSALTADGTYEIDIGRTVDDTVIRHFTFTVSGGEIEPLPQTKLDFEQPLDMIIPRVRDGGGDFVEATWISAK